MQRVSKILFPVTENLNLAPTLITPGILEGAPDGEYVVVDSATGIVADATAKTVEVYVKCGDGLVSSGPIKRGGVKGGYAQSNFDLSVARVLTTSVLPTPAIGTEYVLFVSNQEADNYFLPRQRFSVVADASMITAADLADAFVEQIQTIATDVTVGAKIGSNKELSISVANVAGALEFTGIESNSATGMISSNKKFKYEVLFEVALGNNMETVVIATRVEPDPGCGEGSEVRKMEEIHKGYLGHLNNVTFSSVAYGTGYQYKSVIADPYDLIVVEYDSPHYSIQEGSVPFQEACVFAAPSGGVCVLGGALDALFTAIGLPATW